jgi:hypothetical protein
VASADFKLLLLRLLEFELELDDIELEMLLSLFSV